MTVYMPSSLNSLMSRALFVRCELSRDLTVWGTDVEQCFGSGLWQNCTHPTLSPLRWTFWANVAERHDVPVPNVDSVQLTYEEVLLSVAVEKRLFDGTLETLYRIHHGAKKIYDQIVTEKL